MYDAIRTADGPLSGDPLRPSAKRTLTTVVTMAAAFLAIDGQSATAQLNAPNSAQSSVSISLAQTRPLGALAANIGSGWGIFGSFLRPLDSNGLLSLRADLGVAEYGNERRRTPFSETVGGRVEVDVRTTNAVVPGSIGLQLTPSFGPVAPYVSAGVGAQAFFTESSVEPLGDGSALASTTNQWDIAFAWTLGGGLYVPLTGGMSNVVLDLGVQYVRGGRAQYLAPGSIVDLGGGRVSINPIESTTHLLAVRFGARLGL